jgi:ribosomal protein L11 methyltransferase
VLATDIDPLSITCARENFTKNQVENRCTVRIDPSATTTGSYDLVLANIQSDVLKNLARGLAERVGAGGHIILSGLLSEEVEAVVDVYRLLGLEPVWIRPDETDPQWSAALLRQP